MAPHSADLDVFRTRPSEAAARQHSVVGEMLMIAMMRPMAMMGIMMVVIFAMVPMAVIVARLGEGCRRGQSTEREKRRYEHLHFVFSSDAGSGAGSQYDIINPVLTLRQAFGFRAGETAETH
jgi:hypothetical protein